MKQMSLNESGFKRMTKRARKREFFDEMNLVVPWAELVALIAPHWPSRGTKGGRPPFPVQTMLRIHFLQQWFNLSDSAMEEALNDTPMFREFAGLDVGEDHPPDECTILLFRHLLEANNLSLQIMATVNATLSAKGLLLRQGTVVDATLIAAPRSTKSCTGTRDPEMHQIKRSNQWHRGMKSHIGADTESGLMHSVSTTAANAHDITKTHAETDVFADSSYQGAEKREDVQAEHSDVRWHVAMMPGKRRVLDKSPPMGAELAQLEKTKASIRAKVENPFRVIKLQFGFVKIKYRGLAKNTANLVTLFELSNLWMARKRLMNLAKE